MFCGCGVLVPVESACDYFALLGVPRKFSLDPEQLNHAFLQMQKKLHPDKHTAGGSSDEQLQASTVNSATVNSAYQVLRHPATRASYLVALHGGPNVSEEHGGVTVTDTSLLMHIMELRERIDAAQDTETLRRISDETKENMSQATVEFQTTLDAIEAAAGDADATAVLLQDGAQVAVRLRYFSKVLEEAGAAATRMSLQESQEEARRRKAHE